MEDKKVKLFALSTCVHCRRTKDLLEQFDIPYECVDVDVLTGEERHEALERVKQVNPRCTFPTLVIGDKVIVGFLKDEIREALES